MRASSQLFELPLSTQEHCFLDKLVKISKFLKIFFRDYFFEVISPDFSLLSMHGHLSDDLFQRDSHHADLDCIRMAKVYDVDLTWQGPTVSIETSNDFPQAFSKA